MMEEEQAPSASSYDAIANLIKHWRDRSARNRTGVVSDVVKVPGTANLVLQPATVRAEATVEPQPLTQD